MKKRILFIIFSVLFLGIFSVSVVFLGISIYYPLKFKDDIVLYSNEYDLPPSLVASVINVESGFDELAISSKGAKGLMQILPPTGEWIAKKLGLTTFSESDLFNPRLNIMIGCFYLSYLKNKFSDTATTLAAFNAGEGNVRKWLSNDDYSYDFQEIHSTPFPETNSYMKKVLKHEKHYQNRF